MRTGRFLLIGRLIARDLRRRPVEAALLVLAICAATATLTLGLVLNGMAAQPYDRTRAATAGPDITAMPQQAGASGINTLTPLIHAPGVVGHSGPFPMSFPVLRANGHKVAAAAEGRDEAPAALDRPDVTDGGWVRPGGAVLERGFAEALGVGVGASITLDGRAFQVAGLAVTAAFPEYPSTGAAIPDSYFPGPGPGLVWLTEPDASALAGAARPLTYALNLKLADPAAAEDFENARAGDGALFLDSWQDVGTYDDHNSLNMQRVLLIGSWLLGLLAIAAVTIMVGGRMSDQTRRVGLLKAVGGSPGLVAAVLLAENLLLALVGAVIGMVTGYLVAPLFDGPGAGLIGAAGAPSFTLRTAEIVTAVALAVASVATLRPALRAARTSTVRALAGAGRAPRRRALLIRVSAGLPAPLLLGLRMAARRPRRSLVSGASVAITVCGLVAVITALHSRAAAQDDGFSLLNTVRVERTDQALALIAVMLVILSVVNAVFVAWATALDARRPLAVARVLGTSPRQASAAVSAAQLLPAFPGALLGIPAGLGLYVASEHGSSMVAPPNWTLAATVLGSMVVIAGLTTLATRLGARRSAIEILQSELS